MISNERSLLRCSSESLDSIIHDAFQNFFFRNAVFVHFPGIKSYLSDGSGDEGTKNDISIHCNDRIGSFGFFFCLSLPVHADRYHHYAILNCLSYYPSLLKHKPAILNCPPEYISPVGPQAVNIYDLYPTNSTCIDICIVFFCSSSLYTHMMG